MKYLKKSNKKSIYKLVKQIQMVVFDFDGVFTDNRVIVFENGSEAVTCWRGDGFGISKLQEINIATLVLTTETNPVVSARCKKLKLRCIQGCNDKLKVLKSEAKKKKIPLQNIAYIGNDVNDIACLKAVGLPVCVSGSHYKVKSEAYLMTRMPGGYGAVREFCDFIVKIKNGRLS